MVLKAQGLSKKYGELSVLQSVDLEVKAGDLVSIVGPSGAGKSTLLQILGTLDLPDSGSLEILDQNPIGLKPNELATFRNQKIGFVFQFHHLLPEFTAWENICLPGWIAGKKDTEIRHYATELMQQLGILERKNHKPSELSGGEQQRVSIARALINKPAIILADEPTGNLDSHNAEELHRIFLDLKKSIGQTFIVVTHNPALANLADRILEMKDGILTNQTNHYPG